ncbi:MAG: hypothetical protein ABIL06_17035 [Pseudomonadota bacterium]
MATTEQKTLASKSMTPSLIQYELVNHIKLALSRHQVRRNSNCPNGNPAIQNPRIGHHIFIPRKDATDD